jgi:hypothetical protein
MAIKVIVKRKVAKGKEAELLPLLLDLRTKATSRLGYISGETLRGVEDPQDYMVISTWLSLENWKDWESSPDKYLFLWIIYWFPTRNGSFRIPHRRVGLLNECSRPNRAGRLILLFH